jgi:hypothetical protein
MIGGPAIQTSGHTIEISEFKSMSAIFCAYHEEGHAVADYRFGFCPTLVTIVPHCDKATDGSAGTVYGGDLDSQREQQLISLLAGRVAQSECVRHTIHNGDGDKLPAGAFCGAHSDFERARELLFEGESLRQWIRETREFVKREWLTIDSVARELLDSKTLDDVEVELAIVRIDETLSPQEYSKQLGQYRAFKRLALADKESL